MIIAYDLGTGGVKASLYTDALETAAKAFVEYPTYYPTTKRHEQRPEDWWKGVKQSTRMLLEQSGASADAVRCVSLSGHSLVAVPVDAKGNLLQQQVPIWSDSRAEEQAARFFETIEEREWYMKTGNGFPAPCYSLFKLMWLKENEPDLFASIHKVMGSKDYINFRLTGRIATDHSYASGSGGYSLMQKRMKPNYLEVAGIPERIFPDIVSSHTIIGSVTADAAKKSGFRPERPWPAEAWTMPAWRWALWVRPKAECMFPSGHRVGFRSTRPGRFWILKNARMCSRIFRKICIRPRFPSSPAAAH